MSPATDPVQQVVELDKLNKLVDRALTNLGLQPPERDIVRRVLMYAELRGSSQGLIKIRERTILPDEDCVDISTDHKSTAIAQIDGGGHTGMYVLHTATTVAAELVQNSGIALVSTRNTRSSTGSIGFYANQLAAAGTIAMVLAGSPKVMAAAGGIDPVFGTNPIAIGIPTNEQPLVLDMATAASTWFAVINARDAGQQLPQATAVDSKGNPTVDPVEAMQGALLSFGGAKGSGLAMMFEFLTAVLGNASIYGDQHDNRSNTIIAIDPDMIDNGFRQRSTELIARLKTSRTKVTETTDTATSNANLRLPGENSDDRARQCIACNRVSLDAGLYQHLQTLAQQN